MHPVANAAILAGVCDKRYPGKCRGHLKAHEPCELIDPLRRLPDMCKVRTRCAGMYRRERWEVPLAAALLELRECAARLKLSKVQAVLCAPGTLQCNHSAVGPNVSA